MLAELSVVEQRYLAVREVLDSGAAITDVAVRYGVDRRTVHRWLVRYATGGLSALADRSSKPYTSPHQISPEVEALIVSMRKSHPGWGPRTILNQLRRRLEEPPSRSAIYRALVRHRLIDPKPRRRQRDEYKRWERSRPMELWQMDVMGGMRLPGGSQLSVVTGIDDHSRFCVIAQLVVRATARPVCVSNRMSPQSVHIRGVPGGVEGVGGIAVQSLVQVAVDVENGLDACVTEPRGDDGRVHSLCQVDGIPDRVRGDPCGGGSRTFGRGEAAEHAP